MRAVLFLMSTLIGLELFHCTQLSETYRLLIYTAVAGLILFIFSYIRARELHIIGFFLSLGLLFLYLFELQKFTFLALPFSIVLSLHFYALCIALTQHRFPDDNRLHNDTAWIFSLSFFLTFLTIYIVFSPEKQLAYTNITGFLLVAVNLMLLEFTRRIDPGQNKKVLLPLRLLRSFVYLGYFALVTTLAYFGSSYGASKLPEILETAKKHYVEWGDEGTPTEAIPGDGSGGPGQDSSTQRSIGLDDTVSIPDSIDLFDTPNPLPHIRMEFPDSAGRAWSKSNPVYLRAFTRETFIPDTSSWTTQAPTGNWQPAADPDAAPPVISLKNPRVRDPIRYSVTVNEPKIQHIYHLPGLDEMHLPGIYMRQNIDEYLLRHHDRPGLRYTLSSMPLLFKDLGRQPLFIGRPGLEFLEVPSHPMMKSLKDMLNQQIPAPADPRDIRSHVEGIRRFLQRHYEYSLQVNNPENRAPLDNFLFKEKKGSCLHFSSTMALMLRMRNIPSRVAFGYTSGTLLPDGSVLFGHEQAHAWTEIHLDRFGWIPVDPTPENARPSPPADNAPPPEFSAEDFPDLTEGLPPPPDEAIDETPPDEELPVDEAKVFDIPLTTLAIGCMSIILALLFMQFFRNICAHKIEQRKENSAFDFWREWCRLAESAGIKRRRNQTPQEHLDMLRKAGLVQHEFDEMIRYYYAIWYGDCPRDPQREQIFTRTIQGFQAKSNQDSA